VDLTGGQAPVRRAPYWCLSVPPTIIVLIKQEFVLIAFKFLCSLLRREEPRLQHNSVTAQKIYFAFESAAFRSPSAHRDTP
jgi:hypothetical protein